MNCETTRKNFIYAPESSLSDTERTAYEAHINSCPSCQSEFTVERKLDVLLAHPLDEDPSSRILKRTMQTIEQEQKISRQSNINAGLGLALAASLMLALILPSLFEQTPSPERGVLSTITMSMNAPQTVNIQFDSPKQVADATIIISLPDNLRVAGYDQRKELRWSTALKAGKNTLKLPLVASHSGIGLLRSELVVNGKSKQFNLQVDVAPGQAPTSVINHINV